MSLGGGYNDRWRRALRRAQEANAGLRPTGVPGTTNPIYVDAVPAEGDTWEYNGHVYKNIGGRWWERNGFTWEPVWFLVNPFEHLNLNAFPAALSARPVPMWGNANHAGTADPVALASHIEQMCLLRCMVYLRANTSIEIPLRDGTTFEPLLDPAWPPMSLCRVNVDSGTVNDDLVTTITSTSAKWSGINFGTRPVYESNDVQTDVTFRLEKEPQPYWIATINFVAQGQTTARTLMLNFMGCGAPRYGTETSWDGPAGATAGGGTAPNWRLTDVFPNSLSVAQQAFLDDGNSPSARQSFNVRQMGSLEDYITAGNDPTTTTTGRLYLTDDGLSTGANIFSSVQPPAVFVFGDNVLSTDRGATVTDWHPSSWGQEFGLDGVVADEATQSIQNPANDAYNFVSHLRRDSGAGNKWRLDLWNLSGINDASGSARNSASRHFVVIAFGPDSSP